MPLIKCPNCNEEISDKADKCIHCGAELVKTSASFCEDCGTPINDGEDFCSKCGCPVKQEVELKEKKPIKEDKKEEIKSEPVSEKTVKIEKVDEQPKVIEEVVPAVVKQPKEKKEKKPLNKKVLFIILGVIGALLIAGGVVFYFLTRKSDIYNIAKETSELFTDSEIVEVGGTNETDKYSCIDSVEIRTPTAKITEGKKTAVIIEKYNNNIEAESRRKYNEDFNQLVSDLYKGTILELGEQIKASLDESEDLMFTYHIYNVRINRAYKSDYENLKSKIIAIIDDYDTDDIKTTDSEETIKKYYEDAHNNDKVENEKTKEDAIKQANDTILEYVSKFDQCKKQTCDMLLEELDEYKDYPEIKESYDKVKAKYDEEMQKKKDKVNSINSTLTSVEKSLNKDAYDKVKDEISSLKSDSYYDSYISGWNTRLDKIDAGVYKKSCKNQNYKEALRYPDKYKGTRTYWYGEIVQRVSASQFRVNVNCKRYQYISGWNCSDTIYVVYEGDESFIEDDMVKIWGELDGNYSYTAVLGNEITLPLVRAKYMSR